MSFRMDSWVQHRFPRFSSFQERKQKDGKRGYLPKIPTKKETKKRRVVNQKERKEEEEAGSRNKWD